MKRLSAAMLVICIMLTATRVSDLPLSVAVSVRVRAKIPLLAPSVSVLLGARSGPICVDKRQWPRSSYPALWSYRAEASSPRRLWSPAGCGVRL